MLILAPMQGLTELMFRKTYEQCFPAALDLAVSPFLSLTHGNLADAWKKIDDVIPESNKGSIPVVPQILGKEPDEFIELGNRLHEIGYSEVNWNIGCPMRRVTAKHRGSGILPYPDEVKRILDQVIPNLRLKLSVKMRLGLTDKNEIRQLIPILNSYPLSSITIHPRTGRQQYGGQVDLDAFEQALGQISHKVIYNGDICTEADYKLIRERFPKVKDVMIGRGILYNPILPLQIKGLVTEENKYSEARRFGRALITAIYERPVRDESKMRKAKEYWCLMRKSLPITESQSLEVLHASSPDETREKIFHFLYNN